MEKFDGDEWCPPFADLLHAVAGLCSAALPDMEMQTIYSCLNEAGSKAILVIRDTEGVLEERRRGVNDCGERIYPQDSVSHKSTGLPSISSQTSAEVMDEPRPFYDLFTDSESEESFEEDNDPWYKSRLEFIERTQQRRTMNDFAIESVGAEHRIVGCAAFTRICSKPNSTAVQVTLLAVRRSFRHAGVGSYLIECCKDPAVVGDYDVLLTFADHKAEAFFARHGFTDDPIIASRYKTIADVFQNSSLMCYITPFSGAGLSLDTLTALKQANLHMSTWREQAADAYWQQLTFMERLRHELLIVHGKCEAQEEVISQLKSQLAKAREEKAVLEMEFSEYQQRTKKLLCELSEAGAKQWLANNERV